MPLPPDDRPPAPLPPELAPLTSWPNVEAAAAEAVRRFTTPPPVTRRVTDPDERIAAPRFMPADTTHHDFMGSEGRVAVWTAGDVAWPLVAMLHGWGGRAAQWSAVVPSLLAAQHRVAIIDAPAHGASDGDRASLPAFRNALLRVLDAVGPARGLIGHSLGGLAVLAAIASRASGGAHPLPRAVSIGAPSSVDRPLARFFRRHQATEAVQAEMIAQLERRWHFHWSDLSTEQLALQAARSGGAPLLVVHADDDEQVLPIEAVGLTDAWPGAERWVAPMGGGHLRILRDDVVVRRIVDFVTVPA
jgi:Alpha/beta hydrolase family